jgi:hypothetical protein
MRMPVQQPEVLRETRVGNSLMRPQYAAGLSPQGCNPLACFDAVRRCVANPNPVQCILDIAPNCLDCIPH